MIRLRPRATFALALLVLGLVGQAASAQDVHSVYAPPLAWGKGERLRAHLGPATYTVTVAPVGNVPTQVVGRISYVGPDGRVVVKPFTDRITFRTGNAVAQPVLKLKAVPTGTVCDVTVD